MIEAYKLFWQNYFKLTGRSRRRDFWWPFLINTIIQMLLFGGTNAIENFIIYGEIISTIIYEVVVLVLTIGTFTLSVRRFHDIGLTMTFPIFYLVLVLLPYLTYVLDPIVNYTQLGDNNVIQTIFISVIVAYYIVSCIISLVALAYCTADSENGSNKYGPNPKPIYE